MFVVQDRATGLFYRNTGGSRGRRRNNGDWVADLQDVKPFRTMAAVRNGFKSAGGVQYEFNRMKWESHRTGVPLAHPCCGELKMRVGKPPLNQCEHYKKAVEAKYARAIAKYRVFKVRIALGKEETL